MFARIALIVSLLLCAVIAPLSAQTSTFPDAALGEPYSFDIGQAFAEIQAVLQGIPGVDFSFSFKVSAGLPPGISLTPTGVFSGTPTAAGDYPFTIDFHFSLSVDGQPIFDFPESIPASLKVTGLPTGDAAVTVAPKGLTFNFVQGASAPATQSLAIKNRSQTPRTFSASSSVNWLTVVPSGGTAAPFGATSLTVTAKPPSLAPGTYIGVVSVSLAPTGENFDVLVTATVSGSQAELTLSQSGLRFQAVSGGASPASQSIAVLNGSGGPIDWTASASTTSGGREVS